MASLVPHVTFYAVPRHVDLLREMLRDWALGHHLLALGRQKDALESQGVVVLGSPVCGTREFVAAKLDETIGKAREYVAKAQRLLLNDALDGSVVGANKSTTSATPSSHARRSAARGEVRVVGACVLC